jgi:hypothetical protein
MLPRTTRLVIRFSDDLDPATAIELAGYAVAPTTAAVAARRRRPAPRPRPLKVTSAVYDPAQRTVTLRLREHLSLSKSYRLTVGDGIHGRSGQPLDGDADGAPGGIFAAVFRGMRPMGPGRA